MIETSTLLLFFTASLLLIIAPGPDIVFVVTQGATRGPRAGFITAQGLACGNLVHTLAAALGISVIFQTSALAFHLLKLAGVAYLVYLAWKLLRERSKPSPAEAAPAPAPTGSGLFWRGLLMNVLNPKVALFFLAFLPQFVTPAAGPIWAQMLLFGAMFTVMVMVIFGAFGLFAGKLHGWLAATASPRAGLVTRWGVAGIYLALAARLAVLDR